MNDDQKVCSCLGGDLRRARTRGVPFRVLHFTVLGAKRSIQHRQIDTICWSACTALPKLQASQHHSTKLDCLQIATFPLTDIREACRWFREFRRSVCRRWFTA